MAVEPEDGLQEMAELWSATTADALHRVLVLHPPVREMADSFEPWALLSKHHETEPEQTLTTAVLLLTDRRWNKGVSQLVRRIAEDGLLDEEQLDLLARTFLAADAAVYWAVPDEWFDGGVTIIIDVAAPALDDEADDDADHTADHTADDDDGAENEAAPAVARREVAPPLRRWAAAHVLAREPATWSALFARARELSPRPGAAVMAGVLDRIDVLSAPARAFLIEHATSWPHHDVRRLAFELIAERDGDAAACVLAQEDPNAKIRAWAAGLARGTDVPGGLDATPGRDPQRRDDAEPPTLF